MIGMLLDGPLVGQHINIEGKPPEAIQAHGVPNDAELKPIQPGEEFPLGDAGYVTYRYGLAGIDGVPEPVAQYKQLIETIDENESTLLAEG